MDKIPIDIPATPPARGALQGAAGRKKPAPAPAPPVPQGALRVTSRRDVHDVIAHVRGSLQQRGLKLFAEIDHAAEAQSAGLQLPPAVVLIFGNPKVGTALMQADCAVSLELPLKVAVFRDPASGCTVLSYHAPSALAHQYSALGEQVQPMLEKMDAMLADVCKAAAIGDAGGGIDQ